MNKPLVALVGRPNVGKSTLFNKLVGERLAIVEDVPGTTRDRLYGETEWQGRTFEIVDTGGLDLESEGGITTRVRNQARLAMDEADVIVLLVDGITGLTSDDSDVAQLLRESGKPIVLGVNKTEGRVRHHEAVDFWVLGIGEPFAVSAIHGTGTGELLDAVVEALPPASDEEEDDSGSLRVAIVGRPNVGKSSLVNKLLGEERVIVSEVPGTTRDAIDERLTRDGREYTLIDTAGIRRRGRVEPGIEKYSVMRANRAIRRCDIGVLLIDAVEGVTAQDAHIGGFLQDAGCGALIAVNKWDLIEKDTFTAHTFSEKLRSELKFLDYAPVVFISALTGQRASKLLTMADDVQEQRLTRIPTSELNRLLLDIDARHDLRRKGRPLKIRYVTQVGVAPPTLAFFVNNLELVHFSYERFLENQVRNRYGFEGSPLRLVFREGGRKGDSKR